ncbi:hypothetical protein Bbelb_134450 [Branchiostoma belcheri]|nr:hypothetical protein Bbelb_134450 [Branchiostoma belcheri]
MRGGQQACDFAILDAIRVTDSTMSRSSRFFHSALDFLHALHGRVKHAVKPIVKSTKRRPKAVRRLSSESRNASVTDVPEENDNATPITRLVCQTCEAAKIAQSVTAGRRLDVTCKTALGTCVVGGLVTPPKLEREQSNRKWIPKVTKHKRKAKKEVAANPTPSNMKQEAVSVAINVQPPSPQKMSQPSGGGGCCGGGDCTSDTGPEGALLAVVSRTPRKPTLKALSTPVKTPRRSLATPSLRRRSATPRRRSPRNTELRRVAQVGRAGRTATMVGLGSLMGARAFAGGSVAFLGINLSSTGTQGSTAQSANSPRLLIVTDKLEGPITPGRSPWNTRPGTPYHNHIRNVRTRSVTKARLSASPFAGRLGQDSARTPSHHQLLSSGLKPPKMRSPIVKTISPISFDSAHTPVKTKPRGVRSAFQVRFTETPHVSFRSTPLGTRRKPDLTMSLSSAIKAAGITAKPADDVFEPPNVLTTITAARANYT